MARIVAVENVTLDGVMQSPGRPDEDTRGGFTHGGWAVPYADQVLGEVMGRRMSATMAGDGGLLLGRRTYQDLFSYWPHQTDNPFTPVLDAARKYVVSATLRAPLPWQNSTLVSGAAVGSVAALREQGVDDLTVLGSGQLVRALADAGLVDEYVLLVHPLVLGAGERLFPATGPRHALRLVESVPTGTGVLIATYRPTERADA